MLKGILSSVRRLFRDEPITYPHLADWKYVEAFYDDVAETVAALHTCVALEIGAGEGSRGVEPVLGLSNVSVINTDVYLGGGRDILCSL